MNGTHYWEYKKCEQQAGVLNEEPVADPVAANFTTDKRTGGETAGRSGWKGRGTLWIADPELPLRKR